LRVVKQVDKRLHENYLRKAEEMLDVAQYAVRASKSNAAVVASVHCAINAMDGSPSSTLGSGTAEAMKRHWARSRVR
jgi:hypothetical protein